MWKNIVEADRAQMIIWSTYIACWIPVATNTYSEYVILIVFSTATMVARTSHNVICYAYIACLVNHKDTWHHFLHLRPQLIKHCVYWNSLLSFWCCIKQPYFESSPDKGLSKLCKILLNSITDHSSQLTITLSSQLPDRLTTMYGTERQPPVPTLRLKNSINFLIYNSCQNNFVLLPTTSLTPHPHTSFDWLNSVIIYYLFHACYVSNPAYPPYLIASIIHREK